jgi:hypothetical protein
MQHDQHLHAFAVEVDSGLGGDRRRPAGTLTVRILCMVDTAAKNSNRGGGAVRGGAFLPDRSDDISKKTDMAMHLSRLGMNPNRIATALNVDRATVVRALRWIKGKVAYPDRGHNDP